MSVCVLATGKALVLAASTFTLAWTHSVQKTDWEEDWLLTSAGFEIIEARIKGSGAGMEPPEEAVLRDGWWAYTPGIPALPRIVLAASGATGSPWSICTAQQCVEIDGASVPAVIEPCKH